MLCLENVLKNMISRKAKCLPVTVFSGDGSNLDSIMNSIFVGLDFLCVCTCMPDIVETF